MLREGREIERLGRCGDCVGLLVPWLEKEVLRERADDNSCDNETDWESDLSRSPFHVLHHARQVEHTSNAGILLRPHGGKNGACLHCSMENRCFPSIDLLLSGVCASQDQ